MRISLNDIRTTEGYLSGTLSIPERVLFEARLLINKELRKNVALQREVNALVKHHYHSGIRREFRNAHRRLFNDSRNADITKEIHRIFNP